MILNKWQRIAACVGGAALVGVLLYPPWIVTRRSGAGSGKVISEKRRHAWLVSPPDYTHKMWEKLTWQQSQRFDDELLALFIAKAHAKDLEDDARAREI